MLPGLTTGNQKATMKIIPKARRASQQPVLQEAWALGLPCTSSQTEVNNSGLLDLPCTGAQVVSYHYPPTDLRNPEIMMDWLTPKVRGVRLQGHIPLRHLGRVGQSPTHDKRAAFFLDGL